MADASLILLCGVLEPAYLCFSKPRAVQAATWAPWGAAFPEAVSSQLLCLHVQLFELKKEGKAVVIIFGIFLPSLTFSNLCSASGVWEDLPFTAGRARLSMTVPFHFPLLQLYCSLTPRACQRLSSPFRSFSGSSGTHSSCP